MALTTSERLGQVYAVIPALNPDARLGETVKALREVGFTRFLLIDDGSNAENKAFFPSGEDITLLTHEVNRGKGRALKKAIDYLHTNCPDALGCVTLDADGQHTAADCLACAEKMLETGHFILGCRDFSLPNVPKKSRVGNKSMSLALRLFCGLKISDTQTGLRAMPASCFGDMTKVDGERFEYETNVLLSLADMGLPYEEVTIETVYLDENKGSHYRPLRDSLRILSLILRYIASSVIAFVVDLGLFTLFNSLLLVPQMLSTVLARVVSSLVNFTLNRSMVFRSKAKIPAALLKYYALAVPVMLISMGGVKGVSALFALDEHAPVVTLIKLVIDTVLFTLNFRFQKRWVFKQTK